MFQGDVELLPEVEEGDKFFEEVVKDEYLPEAGKDILEILSFMMNS